jgi:hypothetical protein
MTVQTHLAQRRLIVTGRTPRLLTATCLALAAALAFLAVSASAATTVPARWYSVSCSSQGYYGDYILAQPTRIDHQSGVATGIIDGTGIQYPMTNQYIYFRLWVYSTKYGWVPSAFKRVADGYPSGWPEEWNSQQHAWMATGGGFDIVVDLNGQYSNLSIGADQVGIRVPAGIYRFGVETYWTPPFTTWPSPLDPTIPAGGLDQIDYGTSCTF